MNRLKRIAGTSFEYYESIDKRLSDLNKRLSELRANGKLNPEATAAASRSFKVEEIYHSNAIEGNQLTADETRAVVSQGLTVTRKSLRDQAEAIGLSEAIDFRDALAATQTRRVVLSDLRQIHALVMRGTGDDFAGRYRSGAVEITGSDYSPPPAERVPHEMAALGDYIGRVTSSEESLREKPIVSAAAAHAWLAQIHPFSDGNGRTARLLMNLILVRHGYPLCIIKKQDRLRYIQSLEDSQTSDLTPLLELVVGGVKESLEEWSKVAADARSICSSLAPPS